MDADVKSFVTNTKQSEATAKAVFATIRDEVERLKQSATTSGQGFEKLDSDLNGVSRSSNKFKTELTQLTQDMNAIKASTLGAHQQLEVLNNSFGMLTHVLSGLGIGVTAHELAQIADEYKNLSARVQIAIGEHGNLKQAMADVVNIALKTRSDLSATVDLYTKISKAAGELNKAQKDLFSYSSSATKQFKVSQQDILAITESLNKATQISGSSAEATEASLYQLGQSLSTGVLRGEEYNSVFEGTPRIMQAIATGLGVTTGQLKAMADAGQLTTNVWLPAFLSQTDTLNAEFEKFPLTIGAATNNLKTSWTVYLGELDKTYDVSEAVAKAIKLLADNLDVVGSAFKGLIEAVILYKSIDLARYLSEKSVAFTTTAAAIRAGSAELAANTAATLDNGRAQQSTVSITVSQTKTALEFAQANKQVALSAVESAKQEVQLAQAKVRDIETTRGLLLAEIQLEQQRLKEQISNQGRMQSYTRMAELGKINAQVTKELALAETELNAVRGQASVAAGNYTKATRQIAEATPTLTQRVGALSNTLLAGASRLGAYGAAVAGVVLGGKMLTDVTKSVGTSIGEGLAKWNLHRQGLKTVEEAEAELAEQEKKTKAAAEEAAAAKRREAAASELAKNASLGLNTASKEVVAGFDQQVQSGTKVTEALKGVAEAFSFDSTTGINNGITALMALQKQGKATGDQVKTALSNALDGQDLVVFETNFSTVGAKIQTEMDKTNAELKQKQQAYDEWKRNSANLSYNEWSAQNQKYKDGIAATQAQANTLQTQYNNTVQGAAMVHGAVLDQAIKRTGISYEELQGKSTKAFTTASNDTNVLIGDLDKLKANGVDTGRLLGSSLSKAINTTTNQSELEGLKAKVQGLRGELGTKVADGLLQQIEQKMLDVKAATDQALPGINSVAEAFSKFGIETKEQAQITSQGFIDAFNTMKSSGKATAEQLKQALVQMADQIYASGDSAKKTWYENELAINGLTSKVDEFGKVSVSSLSDISSSANQTRQSFSSLGDEAESDAERSASAWENAADRVDNAKSSMSKKGDSSGSGSGQMSIDGLWANQNSIKSKLTGMGYDDAQATELSQKIYNDSKGHSYTGATKASWDYARRHGITDYTAFSAPSSSNTLYVNEQLEKYKDQFNRGRSKSSEAATSAAADATSNVGSTKTIKLEAPDGKTATMTATPTQADTLESILGQLGQHKKSS